MNRQALVLHLARAQARRAQVQRMVQACPWPVQVLEAVDGRAMSQEAQRAVLATEPLYPPRYPFPLNPGEIGCFLSHRAAWTHLLAQGLEVALILEDDVALDRETLSRVLPLALEAAQQGAYVQLQVRPAKAPYEVLMAGQDGRVIRCQPAMLRTSAQVVSRATAQKLLARTQRLDRPIDALLQLTWETGVPVCMVEPSGVRDAAGVAGGSTIQPIRKPMRERLRRAWQRWRYRRRVKLLARRQGGTGL